MTGELAKPYSLDKITPSPSKYCPVLFSFINTQKNNLVKAVRSIQARSSIATPYNVITGQE